MSAEPNNPIQQAMAAPPRRHDRPDGRDGTATTAVAVNASSSNHPAATSRAAKGAAVQRVSRGTSPPPHRDTGGHPAAVPVAAATGGHRPANSSTLPLLGSGSDSLHATPIPPSLLRQPQDGRAPVDHSAPSAASGLKSRDAMSFRPPLHQLQGDRILSASGSARAKIVSFLSPSSKLEAAVLNEWWYAAASQWSAWADAFAAVVPQMKGSLDLECPSMYHQALAIASTHRTIEQLRTLTADASMDDEDTRNVILMLMGMLVGSSEDVVSTQFPAASVLLRLPSFVRLRAPREVKIGFGQFPPYLMLFAGVTRWLHAVDPRESAASATMCDHMRPWALSLSRWAATSEAAADLPFHKLFLTPLISLMAPPTGRFAAPIAAQPSAPQLHAPAGQTLAQAARWYPYYPLAPEWCELILEVAMQLIKRFVKPEHFAEATERYHHAIRMRLVVREGWTGSLASSSSPPNRAAASNPPATNLTRRTLPAVEGVTTPTTTITTLAPIAAVANSPYRGNVGIEEAERSDNLRPLPIGEKPATATTDEATPQGGDAGRADAAFVRYVDLLDDTNPLLLFSVLCHLQRCFPAQSDRVLQRIIDDLHVPGAGEALVIAEYRLQYLLAVGVSVGPRERGVASATT